MYVQNPAPPPLNREAFQAWLAMQSFGRALGHLLLTEATTTLRQASNAQMVVEEVEVDLELGLGRGFATTSDTPVCACQETDRDGRMQIEI